MDYLKILVYIEDVMLAWTFFTGSKSKITDKMAQEKEITLMWENVGKHTS
jgi:hypothetical protein